MYQPARLTPVAAGDRGYGARAGAGARGQGATWSKRFHMIMVGETAALIPGIPQPVIRTGRGTIGRGTARRAAGLNWSLLADSRACRSARIWTGRLRGIVLSSREHAPHPSTAGQRHATSALRLRQAAQIRGCLTTCASLGRPLRNIPIAVWRNYGKAEDYKDQSTRAEG